MALGPRPTAFNIDPPMVGAEHRWGFMVWPCEVASAMAVMTCTAVRDHHMHRTLVAPPVGRGSHGAIRG